MQDLLAVMAETSVDFTLCFRHLADLAGPRADNPVAEIFELPEAFTPWLGRDLATASYHSSDDWKVGSTSKITPR